MSSDEGDDFQFEDDGDDDEMAGKLARPTPRRAPEGVSLIACLDPPRPPALADLNDDDDDGSISDPGSISDSGFSPISAADKGKGRRGPEGNAFSVDFKVLSAQDLREQQRVAIQAVKDMLGLKVCLVRVAPPS